ncbi:MAG TPA: hypothetical protein PLZ51_29530, partial [Aggregatilineales bacterium]|nr:hypothetical protein [Aggregatilineales bacterium]
KVGGFDWTQTNATLSESRLSQFMSDTLPEDGEWEQDSATGKYFRTITHNGVTRRVIESIDKTHELGRDVTLNDLV